MVLPFVVTGIGKLFGLAISTIILAVIIFLLIPLIVYLIKRKPNGNPLISPNFIQLTIPITATVSYSGTVELNTIQNNTTKNEEYIPFIFISSPIFNYNGILPINSLTSINESNIYNISITSDSNINVGNYAIISLVAGSNGIPSSMIIQKQGRNIGKKISLNFIYTATA